jgi:hypothetical protein
VRRREALRARELAALLALLAAATGCERDEAVSCSGDPPEIVRPGFWERDSHCRGVPADYDEVFGDGVLHVFTITVSSGDYAAMMDDMDEKFSGSSTSIPDLDALPTPIRVPVTVQYGGRTWTRVGMRWKGHSSLKAAWNSGVRKLSFLLDFDAFEELWPEILDQRFFGFERLNFSNAYNDPSLIREKVAAEIFRAAGVPVARVAFAPVYLDRGDGPFYLGLYTLIEDPADELLETQFGDDRGNLYKPWGDAARWRDVGDVDGGLPAWEEDIEEHFEKHTNEDDADWADVMEAVERLHRARNVPAYWRAELEEVLDVSSFLRTLAMSRAMVNWDSYGCMHHNYYLYADPTGGGRLAWFPWDLNEAMLLREQDGCPPPGSVMLDEIVDADDPAIDADWPLIAFLLADGEYREEYRELLRAALDGSFEEGAVIQAMRDAHELIAPWVVGPEEAEAHPYSNTTAERFGGSLTEGDDALEPHVHARHLAVEAALEN